MSDTTTTHLTFSGPATIVHGTLPITISSKQTVGGKDQPLNITLWVPLGLLSEDLKQQAGDSAPLDGLISLKGWHATSNAGDTHFPDTLCIELDNVPDADEPWGRIDKDHPLVVSLAMQPQKDNYEINHQFSINYRGEHLFWRDATSQGKFDVTVAPNDLAAVGQAVPQLNIEFGTSVQDPTALEPGMPVTLHWKVPNGLHGLLKGPQLPSGGQRLTGDRLTTGLPAEQIHVNTTQTYTLEVTVKGDSTHNIQAVRTLTVSALLPQDYGSLAVSPLEVLPYGETRATFSATMVNSAVLEIQEHGEPQPRNKILNAAPGKGRTDDNRSFASEKAGLAIPINTADTMIKLLANVKRKNLLLGSKKVEVLRWEKVINTLPTTLPPRALCFAGTDEQGVLALCAPDGIWLADVGADENRDVSKPEFVKATSLGDGDWLDLTAFEASFAALCRRSSGAVELVRFDLTGTAASTSTPLTVPNDVYAVCAHADGFVRFWDLANLSAGLDGGKVLQRSGHAEGEFVPDDQFNPVTAVAVSGNGLRVVTADYNKTVKVWHTATGQLEHTLSGHADRITALAITADGRRAISGDAYVLNLFPLSGGQELLSQVYLQGGVTHVAFTPDGRQAISFGTPSMLINVWDLEQGMRYIYTNHTGAIKAVAVTPDGTRIITASADATLAVWNLATGARGPVLLGHTGPVNAVAVMPDGSHAVSASDDGTIKVWHLESGSVASTIQCHEQRVRHVAITPDGQRIITYGAFEKYGGRLALWDLKTGKEMAGRNVSLDFAINGIAVTPYDSPRLYSVAGRLLVTFAQGRAYWHDPHKAGKEGSTFVPDRTMTLLPPHDLVAAKESLYSLRRDTGEVQVVAVNKPQTKTMTHTGSRQIEAVAVTPDGSRAVTLLPDGDFEVWNLKDGGIIRNSTGHYDLALIGIAITSDGQHIVAAGRDSLHVWDVKDGKESCTVSANTGRPFSDFALAPDGNSVVTCDNIGTIDIWTLTTGKLTQTRTMYETDTFGLRVTSDSGRIVSAGGRTLKVWDLKTGELKQEFGRQGNSSPERIENLALMPDDKTVITHGGTCTRVWDMASGALKRTMHYAAGTLFSMAGTSDGRLVLAGSVRGEGPNPNDPNKSFYAVNVWNVATGEIERTLSHYQTPERFDRHMPTLQAVAVTADGVLVGNGHALEVWPLKTTLAPAVDELGQSVLANGVPIVLDNLFMVLGDGSYTAARASDATKNKVPQDWGYDPHHEQPAWYRCGHGLDLARDGLVAYRSGSSISLWAVGGKPVGSHDDGRGVVRLNLGLNGLHVFDPNERSSSVAHHS